MNNERMSGYFFFFFFGERRGGERRERGGRGVRLDKVSRIKDLNPKVK